MSQPKTAGRDSEGRLPVAETAGALAVEFNRVRVDRGGLRVLEDVSLAVPVGAFAALVGPNGGGKTTLLQVILGLLRPASGRVTVLGRDPWREPSVRREIGYLAQVQRCDPHFPASVRDVVAMGLLGASTAGSSQTPPGSRPGRLVEDALQAADLGAVARCPIGDVSGGQRQLALLARAIVRRPRLLLLDEPLTGLDQERQAGFYPLLRRLRREFGMTVLAVCHDLRAMEAQADLIYCLDRAIHTHTVSAARGAAQPPGPACPVEAFLAPGRPERA